MRQSLQSTRLLALYREVTKAEADAQRAKRNADAADRSKNEALEQCHDAEERLAASEEAVRKLKAEARDMARKLSDAEDRATEAEREQVKKDARYIAKKLQMGCDETSFMWMNQGKLVLKEKNTLGAKIETTKGPIVVISTHLESHAFACCLACREPLCCAAAAPRPRARGARPGLVGLDEFGELRASQRTLDLVII